MAENRHARSEPRAEAGIAFAVATDFEHNTVARALSFPDAAGRADADPAIVNCGIGCVNRDALENVPAYRCVVSTGFAAALDPKIGSGTVLVPTTVRDRLGNEIDVCPDLHSRVCSALAKDHSVNTARLMQSNHVVRSAAEKKTLFGGTRASAIDMESASLAEVCAEYEVPFVVLRIVLDPQRVSLPRAVLPPTGSATQPSAAAIALNLVKRPADIWPVMILLRHVVRARTALVRAIRQARPVLEDRALS